MLHDLWFQLQTALRRRAVEDDLDEEVRFHLDRETAKHVAQGVAPAEARRRARLGFGQLDVVKTTAGRRGGSVSSTRPDVICATRSGESDEHRGSRA